MITMMRTDWLNGGMIVRREGNEDVYDNGDAGDEFGLG